ncbi:FAD-binding oxidoreductase [Streptomyces yaanensis]|uniref:FAD-binding oxidoreductase n=1 Tax=Streptomyces yaanensis TaxID=1142239 RepID=A0ABV7S8N5_9ACTN|nr:FAD-binding oxidoreductase [Streptomyces sp. CGMCC 4.7035]WNC02859.1 FAD-binding oxidoreductase [Streptomyces sp. CGMCC 4.7035]
MSRHTQMRGLGAIAVRRDDADYEDVRRSVLWNELVPARFPDVIVRPASAHEVVEAVRLARSQGLRVAMRSGGHSWCVSPLRDGGMLIDLSGLRTCTVDPASATATVQPGTTGQELTSELGRHGLAFPAGHCGSVAVGGYLLSGGLGWNSGVRGPACADVHEIEAVTADGEPVTCSEREHPDLFWAARGAGPGFFAAVTAFRLRLYRQPGAITRTTWTFSLADVAEVMDWATGAASGLSPNVELSFSLGTADPGTTPGRKVVTVTGTAFASTREEADAFLGPLRSCPLAERSLARQLDAPMTFRTLYEGSAALWPPDHRYAADTLWSDADFPTLLGQLADAVDAAPSSRSLVLAPVTPAAPPSQDMAFSVLGESYVVPYAVWDDPQQDAANIDWLRQAMHAVESLGTGHYIAETDLTAASSRARRSFTPDDWQRLGTLKARYDPDDVFCSYLTPEDAPA